MDCLGIWLHTLYTNKREGVSTVNYVQVSYNAHDTAEMMCGLLFASHKNAGMI